MKTLYILTAVLLVVTLTSMMPEEQKSSQQAQASSMEENQPMFHKGMITFKVKEGAGEFVKQDENVSFNIASLDAKASRYKVDLIDKRFRYNPNKLKKDMPDLSRIYRIEFPEEISVTKVAREFSKDPNIEYAEPIPVNYLMVEPNDPMYVQQQHLPQIFAPEAWNIHKGENGEEEVVIAIVDSGVDWDPEDLVENIWQNMGEDVDGDGRTIEFIGGEWVLDPDDENGIDDDGNGYVDDFIGWNFFYFNNDPNPVPGIPDNDHGTHCAGIASATTDNNVGVAGIGWNLKILAIESGLNISIHHCYDAIIYAAENGADVISNSWSAHIYAQANHEAITYATGLGSIIVAAAGNHNYFSNFYPADYPGVVSVAAVQPNDHKASFSNYGPNIWVSAPGTGILSTLPNNTYQSWSGTSMATPLVAGLLGLVKSYHPEWTSSQVITQVLGTADDIDQVNPGFENLLGSGRINAFHALDSSGVTLDQEISLDLVNSTCYDDDNDQMLEPGDVVNMSIKLRNYNFGIGASNATFTLLCNDPDITISNNSCSADIPADDYFNLEHVFEFQISEQATTHLAVLKLITTADVEITWGDTISLEIPVAPEGILVFQGEGTGNAFSGEYINDCLSEQGFQVYYTSHFPFSFNGFDAVFMSYGNYGDRIDDGVIVTFEMTEVMTEYLLDGGYIYAECGSFFGGMAYVGYPNLPEMLELFGVDELEVSTSSQNPINLLTGLSGSVGEELVFDGSTQSPNWYIDKYTPNENGVAAFEEDGYGTVAVQGEGEYGQKTFCFAYALAHLVDGDPPNTRDTLLARIINFFELEPETPNNFINIPEDYPTIQQGIDVADEGDTVLVAPGTYVENINFSGKNITVASHFLTTNDTAYISQTIIDGDSITSVVVFENGEDSSAVLNGFTLTKGSGTVIPWPIGPGTYGGGIYISASRPSICNSIISGNYADNGGGIYSGGLYPDSSNATLLNVTLKLNSANDFGGGLYIGYGSHLTLVDSKIEENFANYGGGVCCGNISPDFRNVTVSGNVAKNGGGIYFSNPITFGDNIDRCNVYENYALHGNDLYSGVDVEIAIDTFSVLNPTEYHACPVENFEFDVLNGMIEQADADLFV
nr:S8 family serine peptidase [Bacteroidota bacterium]